MTDQLSSNFVSETKELLLDGISRLMLDVLEITKSRKYEINFLNGWTIIAKKGKSKW